MVEKFTALSPHAKAAALMIIAVLFFSAMDGIAKGLTQRYHSLEVVWARYFFQLVLSFTIVAPRLRVLLRTNNPGLQLVRSSFLFIATICFFYSIKFMPLASATAIFEVAPLMITALAVFVLGETVGWRRWAAVIMGLCGAVIIIQPTSPNFALTDLLPLLAAFGFAAYAISTRFLSKDENPVTSFLYTGLIGTIFASALVISVWQTPTPIDWVLMMLIGAGGALAHFLLIRALTMGEASFLAPFAYFSLLFNALWGYLFFAEVPSIYVWVGSAVIIVAGIFVWHIERKAQEFERAEEPLI